jgi:hypothetical protein
VRTASAHLPRLVALAAVVLLLAAVPAAAGEHKKVRHTRAGMAAARAPQIKEADLPPVGGWTGGADATGRSSETLCSLLHPPKQSDLVVIGDAGAHWAHTGLQIWSGAQVLETPRMVALDWQRKIGTAEFMPCLRESAKKSAGSGWHFVSLRRLSFPKVGTRTAAYRALYDVDSAAERLMVDVVFYGHGRTELTLTTIAPVSAATQLEAIQVRVARQLDTRIRT